MMTRARSRPRRLCHVDIVWPARRMLYSREARADELEEEILRPVFAVSGECAGDETSPPCDGMEYLRRVRKEAGQLPGVVRAATIDPGRL